jgi:hypothetical protein
MGRNDRAARRLKAARFALWRNKHDETGMLEWGLTLPRISGYNSTLGEVT